MCQNKTDGVGLREWQHGDVHFHGGAVGGVDVKSALWTHSKQLVPGICCRMCCTTDIHSTGCYPTMCE